VGARARCLGGALVLLAACSGPAVRKEPARVHFVVEPVTARVYVDDELVGTGRVLARTNVIVANGAHQVTVEAPGYFPHDFAMNAVPGITEAKVALRKVPE
jgi:hypothetical protein